MAFDVAVVTFPGSNCDADLRWAVDNTAGLSARAVWHKSADLDNGGKRPDAVLLPGGFSYGDYLRCGAIARFSPVMKAVVEFANAGGPVLGICNGFQVLTEAGLLPGALLSNRDQKFICEMVTLGKEGRDTPFTAGIPTTLRIPIAHHDGNYFADEDTLARIEGEGQVLFRYLSESGERVAGAAPNGALHDIAGICNAAGNVVGMMPHPERASDAALGSSDGASLFGALQSFLENQ